MQARVRWIMAAVVALTVCAAVGAAIARSWRPDLAGRAAGEGRLVIYSATDNAEAAELISAFHHRYPTVAIEYDSLTAQQVFARFKSEADQHRDRADIVMNSAMDLQVKLANDGYAAAYASAEAAALPEGAIWRDQLFAVSAEPIVIGYNPKLLPAMLVPASHDALASLLHRRPDVFVGQVGSYDPMQSPTGHLYLTQEWRHRSRARR